MKHSLPRLSLLPAAALVALLLLPADGHAGTDTLPPGEPGAGLAALTDTPAAAKTAAKTAAAKPAAAKAAGTSADRYTLRYGARREGRRTDAAMQHFRDSRLGLIVHWGLYAIPGGEWNGRLYPASSSFIRASAHIPKEEYRALMKQWDPAAFDARAFVRRIKAAGFRYIKLTTKHHDGFCLWPTAYTDFSVANTPSKRDIVGEFAQACSAEGIDLHLYYSILDWDHPDWRGSLRTDADRAAFARYLTFAENQLRELAARYPTVKDFWFDGTWDASVRANGAWTLKIEQMLKSLIPGVTVNSRLRADDRGSRHFDSNGRLMGDYESGYERRLPDPIRDLRVTAYDWEALMTLPVNKWGYHKDWTDSCVKNGPEILERIVHAVSMGGNMAVNLGPKADGSLRDEETAMLRTVGDWMKTNGAAIYGCGPAGLPKQPWGYFTQAKNGALYAAVFNPPLSGHLTLDLPRTCRPLPHGTLLATGESLPLRHEEGSRWLLDTPRNPPAGTPYVIRIR